MPNQPTPPAWNGGMWRFSIQNIRETLAHQDGGGVARRRIFVAVALRELVHRPPRCRAPRLVEAASFLAEQDHDVTAKTRDGGAALRENGFPDAAELRREDAGVIDRLVGVVDHPSRDRVDERMPELFGFVGSA